MTGKKYLFGYAALALAAGITGGCAAHMDTVIPEMPETTQTEADLTFFGFKYEALNVLAIEDALHSYMDAYPKISIAYDGIKSPEYFDVLEKRLATGNGDDIFMVDHERVLTLARQGKLADLSGLSTLDNFSSLAKSQMTADGTVDYLPTSISAFGLYCNKSLLRSHKQEIPENLSEFEEVCDYFVSQGITPVVANNDISLKTIVLAKSLLPLYSTPGTAEQIARYNSGEADIAEALRPGFSLVEQMIKRGWVDSGEALATAKTKDDLEIFARGERPFMLTGAWAVPRLRELNPGFQFEVHPYPVMDDGCALVINVDTRISINADSPNLKEAQHFVEYFTQPDVMWDFVNSQSSFSPLAENRLAEDEAVHSIGPYLTNGRSVIGSDDNFNFPIWEMTRQCVVGMLKGDSTQDTVDNMRTQMGQWASSQ